MKIPKLPPIRVVRERIDDEFCAVIAFCFRVGRQRYYDSDARQTMTRPVLYGISVFALVPAAESSWWRCDEIGRTRLMAELGTRGRLPYIGVCSDLPGWADYE
jgi:hypothetical protein